MMFGLASAQAMALPPDISLGKTLTAEDMQQLLPRVQRKDLRTFLGKAITECVAANWVDCHVALFDAEQSGMPFFANDSSGDEFNHSSDVKANQIWNGLTSLMSNNPQTYNDFQMQIKRKYNEIDVISDIPAAIGLHDDVVREMTTRIVQQYFKTARIPYDVRAKIARPRGEWIRQLTLMSMVRGDMRNAYRGLSILAPYAKMGNRKDTWVVQQTYYAVTTYFKIAHENVTDKTKHGENKE